jgi:hypothetical protein
MLDPALEIRCEDKWIHQNIREKIEKRVCEWLNAGRQLASMTYLYAAVFSKIRRISNAASFTPIFRKRRMIYASVRNTLF